MSIQWTLIALFLYLEIAIVMVLLLPILNPRRWRAVFNSRIFLVFKQHTGIYFYVSIAILALFNVDAFREMMKYSHTKDVSNHVHMAAEMKNSIKLFRAQRNLYITSFAIFLAFVIKRIINMIIVQAGLLDRAENIITEAERAKDLAKETVISNLLEKNETLEALNKVEELRKQKDEEIKHLKEENSTLKETVIIWKSKYETLITSREVEA